MLYWLRGIKIPNKIPIKRIKDYHTHYLGKNSEGTLFFGYLTFVFSKPTSEINTGNQGNYKDYAVLHTFDREGNYLNTNHWCDGVTREANDEILTAKLEEMIAELGEIKYCNIKVKPFQTIIDEHLFGLIRDEEYQTVDLEPSSTISFHAPWNGEYDT